ncbi:iron-containing alcohol dehydrogenase [Paludisphaera rhizosphaerae]|uniref:iron-containing alcohol dehydrogenase n=1 Tax=Paludisphaera rhizosphaerae TaxID=2711216 RepID=UPI0013E9DE12|nr:iron-containing alcohol dehydrogenase [Paludisphaera rhizosphaerae]
MNFEFATAGRIVFGWEAFEQLPRMIKELGSKALLVLGREGRYGEVLSARLADLDIASLAFRVEGEPRFQTVEAATAMARAEDCNVVVAIGGGSVIDAGKAAAAMATQYGSLLDHLEVVGAGRPLTASPLPFIAIPTTAGTGSEVTRNAVLDVPEHRVKVSLRSPDMLPRVALVDPALTLTVPPEVTAYTGMDALTQLIEPFVSLAANPMTDGLCREGITRAARSLEAAFRDGSNREAREDMAVASLLGGLALANAKLGAVHGFAGVLGGMFGLHHGAICARLLPFVMEANIAELQIRGDGDQTMRRYREVATMLTGDPNAEVHDGVAWVRDLCARLAIAPLRLNASQADQDAVIAGAQRASSMKGNPVPLSEDRLRAILAAAD